MPYLDWVCDMDEPDTLKRNFSSVQRVSSATLSLSSRDFIQKICFQTKIHWYFGNLKASLSHVWYFLITFSFWYSSHSRCNGRMDKIINLLGASILRRRQKYAAIHKSAAEDDYRESGWYSESVCAIVAICIPE